MSRRSQSQGNRFDSADPLHIDRVYGGWRRKESAADRFIEFRIRHALQALAASLSLYAVVAILAYLLSRMGYSDSANLAIVHLGSAGGLLAFWRMGRWGRARYECFGAAVLLFAVALRLQAFVDTLAFGTRFDEIYRYPHVPMPDDAFPVFLKAETITLVGLLVVACAWRWRIGSHVEAYSFLRNVNSAPLRISSAVYLAAVLAAVATRVMGVSFGAMAQLNHVLAMAGVAAIYFVAARATSRAGRVAAALGLALPMTYLALGGGMKSDIFMPVVPAAILLWANYRNPLVRLAFVSAAILALAISQMYVHHVRAISWHVDGIEQHSTRELVADFLEDLPNVHLVDAVESISSRMNMTASRAITVTLADQNGFEPGNVFAPIPATFVPRFIWQDKPVLAPGAQHTARILGSDALLSEIRTATAPGFVAELYLGGWWAAVLLGMAAFGSLLASVQQWTRRISSGFSHLALCFVAFLWALRFDENHVVYSYTGVVLMALVLWALSWAAGIFGPNSNAARTPTQLRESRP